MNVLLRCWFFGAALILALAGAARDASAVGFITSGSGTLSNGNQTFSAEASPTKFYSSVVLDQTFEGGQDFELITAWGHDYIGLGMVYGATVSHTSFNGYSANSLGPYWGALNTTGFANGTVGTYYGHHIFSSWATLRYFRHRRAGDTLSLAVSEDGVSWSNLLAPITIASTDRVAIGLGESNYVESSPLTIISFSAEGSAVPEPATLIALSLGGLVSLRRRRTRR